VIFGIFTAFGLGFVYFISAIPAGVAAHAPLWVAALAAWLGYSAGGALMLIAGRPLRAWMMRKLNISPHPDPQKFFWRIWARFGLWGLSLIAPVTIGPQATAVVALALGEKAPRIQIAITLGSLPWAILFGLFTSFGKQAILQSPW
jgi:hypothetical protein